MDGRFVCNPVEVFSIFELAAWVERERAAGRLPASGELTLGVFHPDREMDGSCRWCGCREDESLVIGIDCSIAQSRRSPH